MWNVLGWVLLIVLVVGGVRYFTQRRKLHTGKMQRCPHCGDPYEGEPYYCPSCGDILKHTSHRR